MFQYIKWISVVYLAMLNIVSTVIESSTSSSSPSQSSSSSSFYSSISLSSQSSVLNWNYLLNVFDWVWVCVYWVCVWFGFCILLFTLRNRCSKAFLAPIVHCNFNCNCNAFAAVLISLSYHTCRFLFLQVSNDLSDL